jgi:anaerobic selenocysteine-containing dehydrogenase
MTSSIPIVCPYCGVGCNLELTPDENGRPVKSSAAGRNPELNAKYACVKGFTVHEPPKRFFRWGRIRRLPTRSSGCRSRNALKKAAST